MSDNFFEKSLNTIELPAVLGMLSAEAVCQGAKEAALSLQPAADLKEVERRKNETEAAFSMMVLKGSPSFSGVKDLRASLERAELGGCLNTRELLEIASVLRSARLARAYPGDDPDKKTCIDYLFSSLKANRQLEEKISASIVSEDEIADAASPELADIRRKMRASAARAREVLQKLISGGGSKYLQEQIITSRAGRFVVPVKAEYKNSIPGLVHDVSASGATLFVEPMGAVKANNELREFEAKEKAEIERILFELSAECAGQRNDIEADYSTLLRLDLIFAKAKLAFKQDAVKAESLERGISLKKARHPLLKKENCVPIDIELGGEFDTLIITGPNTGGKTVSLKTAGLLAAMNQCGLFIPASQGSALGIFEGIFADIGDEQSIEQSLSTFSSHMKNIVKILEECNSGSLVLFDELGAGTDPAEGAALAQAIIDEVRKRGAMVLATTHYTELKVYATNEPKVQNASCEFSLETLRPTYRLLIGIPGKSNAFAISERLGLGRDIIENAKESIGASNASLEATIEKLEHSRLLLEQQRQEEQRLLSDALEKNRKASLLKAELEVRLEKAELKARREAEDILTDARQRAEQVFSELDEMRSAANEQQETAEINEARNALRRKINEGIEKTERRERPRENRVSSRKVRPGDVVEIKSLGMKAEVVSVSPDGMLSLKAGIMNVSAAEKDVYLLEGEKIAERKNYRQSTELRAQTTKPELDLRGMDSIEAVAAAESFIDGAVLARLNTVTIIHGKGTGALRKAIHQMLKKNRAVKSFRLGNFGEGESGVTIVEIK